MELIFARYAIRYASQGFHVFPLAPGSKKPMKDSIGLTEATVDLGKIAYWSTLVPTANIGIRTGDVSGISVIDIDPAHGGFEVESGLRAQGKCFPHHAVVRTRSGGRHVYVKHHPLLVTGTNRIGHGIDIRGDGGYVVAPPSVVEGKVYKWLLWKGEIPDAPDWLLQFMLDEKERHDREERQKSAKFYDNCRPKSVIIEGIERSRYTGFAWKAVEAEAATVASTVKPGRNRALFDAACKLGKWISNGILSANDIAKELGNAALENGLVRENGWRDVWNTIGDGFKYSQNDPLPILAERPRKVA